MYSSDCQVLSSNNHSFEERDFHGAAIVDSHGREIPITADMVDQAVMQTRDFYWPSNTCPAN